MVTAYWTLFFLTGAGALLAAKWLDDQERRRWQRERPTQPDRPGSGRAGT